MSTHQWGDMPQDVALALENASMRAAVSQQAGSIINATILFSIKIRKPHRNCPRPPSRPVHRGRCPRPLDDALKPLLTEYVFDCLDRRKSLPSHAARVTPDQRARTSRTVAQRLAQHRYLSGEQCLQVVIGMFELATAIMGDSVQACEAAVAWVQRYLERVLVHYGDRRY